MGAETVAEADEAPYTFEAFTETTNVDWADGKPAIMQRETAAATLHVRVVVPFVAVATYPVRAKPFEVGAVQSIMKRYRPEMRRGWPGAFGTLVCNVETEADENAPVPATFVAATRNV